MKEWEKKQDQKKTERHSKQNLQKNGGGVVQPKRDTSPMIASISLGEVCYNSLFCNMRQKSMAKRIVG